MKKYNIGYIHNKSNAYHHMDQQINIFCNGWTDLQETMREMIIFFTNAHGPGCDSSTLGLLGFLSNEENPKKPWLNKTVKFQWAYKIPTYSSDPIQIYVSNEALATFKFWYPNNGSDITIHG